MKVTRAEDETSMICKQMRTRHRKMRLKATQTNLNFVKERLYSTSVTHSTSECGRDETVRVKQRHSGC